MLYGLATVPSNITVITLRIIRISFLHSFCTPDLKCPAFFWCSSIILEAWIILEAEEIIFEGRINTDKLPQDQGISLDSIVRLVCHLFTEMIRRATQNLEPSDLICFCIKAEGLDKPISTNLMTVATLTLEKLLSTVVKVLQSKDEIKLDSGFPTDVIIKRLVGAGRRKWTNIAVDRLKKRSIWTIPFNNEGLCCAKAIVYPIAHLENDWTAIETLRNRRRPALLNRAKALHEAAGVPLRPCTFQEVAQFEHLNLHIVVFSSDNMNRVSFCNFCFLVHL